MNRVQIIKRDEIGEMSKTFENNTVYEQLKTGDIIEIEYNNRVRDYIVVSGNWIFSHFGNILTLAVEPIDWNKNSKI